LGNVFRTQPMGSIGHGSWSQLEPREAETSWSYRGPRPAEAMGSRDQLRHHNSLGSWGRGMPTPTGATGRENNWSRGKLLLGRAIAKWVVGTAGSIYQVKPREAEASWCHKKLPSGRSIAHWLSRRCLREGAATTFSLGAPRRKSATPAKRNNLSSSR